MLPRPPKTQRVPPRRHGQNPRDPRGVRPIEEQMEAAAKREAQDRCGNDGGRMHEHVEARRESGDPRHAPMRQCAMGYPRNADKRKVLEVVWRHAAKPASASDGNEVYERNAGMEEMDGARYERPAREPRGMMTGLSQGMISPERSLVTSVPGRPKTQVGRALRQQSPVP